MTHRLKSGDFILISSDGLFDNLYEDEIALLVDRHINNNLSGSVLEETTNNTTTTQMNPSVSDKPKTVNITSDLLSSACELLVDKASIGINKKLTFQKLFRNTKKNLIKIFFSCISAGIKKDDMLIMLIYIS